MKEKTNSIEGTFKCQALCTYASHSLRLRMTYILKYQTLKSTMWKHTHNSWYKTIIQFNCWKFLTNYNYFLFLSLKLHKDMEKQISTLRKENTKSEQKNQNIFRLVGNSELDTIHATSNVDWCYGSDFMFTTQTTVMMMMAQWWAPLVWSFKFTATANANSSKSIICEANVHKQNIYTNTHAHKHKCKLLYGNRTLMSVRCHSDRLRAEFVYLHDFCNASTQAYYAQWHRIVFCSLRFISMKAFKTLLKHLRP